MLRLSDDGLSAVPMLVGEMLGEMPSSEMMLLKQECLLLILIKIGRCAQIPAIFENLIPRPEEKKDIFTDTPIFDD